MNKRYQVFISSTFRDLEKEREIAVQSLMKLDCIPSGMELFPAADIEQFEFIKSVISDCDYYVLIIGGKYGTITEEGVSYTEKEYDFAINQKIPVLAFLHKTPEKLSVENAEITKEARDKLDSFRAKASKGRLVEFWENKDQLAYQITTGIISAIKIHPAIGWVKADKTSSSETISELNELRKQNIAYSEKIQTLMENTEVLRIEFDILKRKRNSISNLAELTDKVKINGTYPIYKDGGFFATSTDNIWSINIKLSDIFICLGPKLSKHTHEPTCLDIIKEIIIKAINMNSPNINKKPPSFKFEIEDSYLWRLKYQFVSLDLITAELLKSESGSNEIFWKLTEKGNQSLMEVMTFIKE